MELLNKLMKKPAKLAFIIVILVLMIVAIRQGWLPNTLQIFTKTEQPKQSPPKSA